MKLAIKKHCEELRRGHRAGASSRCSSAATSWATSASTCRPGCRCWARTSSTTRRVLDRAGGHAGPGADGRHRRRRGGRDPARRARERPAQITMKMRKKYTPIYEDATVLLRPKTGLKDMVVAARPGHGRGGQGARGRGHPGRPDAARRQRRRDPLARSTPTRATTCSCCSAAPARRSAATAGTARRRSGASSPPAATSPRSTARSRSASANIRRSVHNFQLLADALGDKDDQLATLVDSSNAVFRAFARQDANLTGDAAASCRPRCRPPTPRWPSPTSSRQVLGPTLGACAPARARSARRCGRRGRSCARPRRSSRTSCGPSPSRPARRSSPAAGGPDLAALTPDLDDHVQRPQLAAQRAGLQPAGQGGGLPLLALAGSTTSARRSSRPRTRTARSAAASSSRLHLARHAAGAPHRQPAARHDCRPAQPAQDEPGLQVGDDRHPGGPQGGEALVQKPAPSVGRILVMVGFALSCFGLLLFLWLAFGGPVPLKPKGYRFTVSFQEADAARPGGRRADLRRPRRQGQDDRADKRTGSTDATIELEPQLRADAERRQAILRQKTLLGETYVELTPGRTRRRTTPSPTAAGWPPATSRRPSSSTRSSAPSTPRRGWPSRSGCRPRRRRSPAAAATSTTRFGNLRPFAEDTSVARQDPQRPGAAVRGWSCATPASSSTRLTEREGQLRGLITNCNRVFATTAARNADLQQIFLALPTFERESRDDAQAPRRRSPSTRTRSSRSCARRRGS